MGSLFNSDTDRELYIRLNAERQIEWEKGLTYFDKESGTMKPTLQARNPRSMEVAMEISRRQVDYDEQKGRLRYTMEQLLLLTREELIDVEQANFKELLKKFELL